MKQIVQNLSPETPTEFAYGLRLEVRNDRFQIHILTITVNFVLSYQAFCVRNATEKNLI